MWFFEMIGCLLFKESRHNYMLEKKGLVKPDEVRYTTIGWRPDPWYGEDGYTPDPGNNRVVGTDPVTGYEMYDTPSGNLEYHRYVGKKPKNWRD